MAADAKAPPAPNNQGGASGGGKKKRNRKRGGGGGGPGGPQTNASNYSNAKDASSGGRGGGPPSTASSSAGGRGGGSKNKRSGGRGGGGGRGSGGGSELSSRFKPSASSPLQLPHIKVTLRNLSSDHGIISNNKDSTKHSSIESIVESVKFFLEGAFPKARFGAMESEAYMAAWNMEKEEFEGAKGMFAEAANGASGSGGSDAGGAGSVGGSTSGGSAASSTAFSSGWVYQNQPTSLPTNRESLLPTSSDIVTTLLSNQTDKKILPTSNMNWVVDTAMSQMMQECGKTYLNYVGGRIILDEESAVDVVLAEKVKGERKKIEEEKRKEKMMEEEKKRLEEEAKNAEAEDAVDGDGANGENPTSEKKDETSVEAVTQGIQKLSTSSQPPASKPQQSSSSTSPLSSSLNQQPMIRIRILSISPVKKSKRRGEIGGKVQLALYPPDPCLLFKDGCRDAGKLAAELQGEEVTRREAEKEAEMAAAAKEEAEKEAAAAAAKEAEAEIAAVKEDENAASVEKAGEEDEAKDNDESRKEVETSEGKDGTKADEPCDAKADGVKADESPDAKDANNSKPSSLPVKKVVPPPLIPYYPLLSPAERSRAVARSRVLLSRTIEALKIHAAQSKDASHEWEILESASQKTWKGRPHPMVDSLMSGDKPLRDLVVENDTVKTTTGVAKKQGRRYDSRSDRYDSTIDSSEDYKAFMESLQSGDAIPVTKEQAAKDAKKGDAKSKKDEPTPVDEEGRPLSAIVMYMREKQGEADKIRAESAAAQAKSRSATAAAKEKVRKDKLKLKKEVSKKKKREQKAMSRNAKKSSSSRGGGSSSSGRPGSGGGSRSASSASMPPPGAMLLKKGGVSSAIPPSGFGGS